MKLLKSVQEIKDAIDANKTLYQTYAVRSYKEGDRYFYERDTSGKTFNVKRALDKKITEITEEHFRFGLNHLTIKLT